MIFFFMELHSKVIIIVIISLRKTVFRGTAENNLNLPARSRSINLFYLPIGLIKKREREKRN